MKLQVGKTPGEGLCMCHDHFITFKENKSCKKKIKSLLAFLKFCLLVLPNYHKSDVVCYDCTIGQLRHN